mgnify:CR=1 FL=1
MKNVMMNGPIKDLRISLSNFLIMQWETNSNELFVVIYAMNPFSKLTLSADEQQLVTNTGWILTKRKITGKVDQLLGHVSVLQQAMLAKEKNWLPDAVLTSAPKIARGENYLGLPYLLLDYPRCFSGDDIFAVRTMFWWGNFFSITLHLSGKYKAMFQQKIIDHVRTVQEQVFICVHESQWQHHFEADNYRAVQQMAAEDLLQSIREKSFVKLAIPFPLQAWNDIPLLLDKAFAEIIIMLKD